MRLLGFGAGLCLLAGIAFLVVPRLLPPHQHKSSPNETAAIASLRNLGHVQLQFRNSGRCDLDGDGLGEFGTYGELTGADGVRTRPDATTRGDLVQPPLLSPSLAAVGEEGAVCKSGFAFRVFLPGARTQAVREGRASAWTGSVRPPVKSGPGPAAPIPGTPFSGPVDVDGTERHWCAYAWPMAHGHSGSRTFFVVEDGTVWWTTNGDGRYSGFLAGPAWGAAMPVDAGSLPWAPPPKDGREYRGRDGNVWKRTN